MNCSCEQQRLRPACAVTQADLNLHCQQVLQGVLSLGTAPLIETWRQCIWIMSSEITSKWALNFEDNRRKKKKKIEIRPFLLVYKCISLSSPFSSRWNIRCLWSSLAKKIMKNGKHWSDFYTTLNLIFSFKHTVFQYTI